MLMLLSAFSFASKISICVKNNSDYQVLGTFSYWDNHGHTGIGLGRITDSGATACSTTPMVFPVGYINGLHTSAEVNKMKGPMPIKPDVTCTQQGMLDMTALPKSIDLVVSNSGTDQVACQIVYHYQ
ncbi:MAG: hypothetical protein COV52_03025 [Gammaproteobacteria bacterium CG11_big_fil_rev_8_21_14_0_20_46_22]|nr:MAG: hypothetical protein COW05_05975 [Gammaproteobacteria bacterium CG12_big_fil_rev_8_21_14_0_65_46_12]PIR11604.1 MAG: hypothetical protein COV52_03025 [Gammaproteobacteria bacterium CG11_big_fil_rev_8_21_14_0_20_46_22]